MHFLTVGILLLVCYEMNNFLFSMSHLYFHTSPKSNLCFIASNSSRNDLLHDLHDGADSFLDIPFISDQRIKLHDVHGNEVSRFFDALDQFHDV